MLTLTVAEIYDLACMAGFTIHHTPAFMPGSDDMETEIIVMVCPKEGVLNDDGKPEHYTHIAYFADYPEEGSHPLGEKLT